MRPGKGQIQFSLGDDSSPDGLIDALRTQFDVEVERRRSFDCTVLDTFDGRLARAGLRLEETPAGGGQVTLHLRSNGARPSAATLTPRRTDRLMGEELGDGPLAARVAPLIAERALLAVDRQRGKVTHVLLRGDEAKTVARVDIERPGNLVLRPVLGYDRPFEQAAAILGTTCGLVPVAPATAAKRKPKQDDPSRPALAATAAILHRLADTAEAQLPGITADLDTEFLHDFRVAVRRSRSVLKEMRPVFADDERRQAADGLRWLQQLTGPVRDLDVMLLDLPERTAGLPDVFAGQADRLHTVLSDRRQRAQRSLARALKGARFQRTWAEVRAFAAEPGTVAGPLAAEPVGAVAGTRIGKLYRRMVRAGKVITPETPPEVLHDLRKQGKELRYMLELFGPLWPQRDVQPVVAQLRALQDVLGTFHDRHVQAEWLQSLARDLAAEESDVDTALLLGAVVDRLASDGDDIRTTIADQFAPFASSATRAAVRRTFGAG